MAHQFSLDASGDRAEVNARIRNRAEADPAILYLDRGKLGALIAFCETADFAKRQAQHYETSSVLSPSICYLEIDSYGIRANQEGADDSAAQLREFVLWILESFAPCRVFDDDRGEVTEEVERDPAFLF